MATIQLDLFGWADAPETHLTHERIPDSPVTSDVLANALIKYLGEWVPNQINLLGDDSTVCETLVTIHKVFTRDELQAVDEDTWKAAWNDFESFYLTKRIRSTFYWPWPTRDPE